MTGLAAYLAAVRSCLHDVFATNPGKSTPFNVDGMDERHPAGWIYLYPQFIIEDYRVDFLVAYSITNGRWAALIVECDGHDFHDRTPYQASRDRERDRFLQANGFPVFRFTGTDLNRRPIECADEVLHFIIGRIGAAERVVV